VKKCCRRGGEGVCVVKEWWEWKKSRGNPHYIYVSLIWTHESVEYTSNETYGQFSSLGVLTLVSPISASPPLGLITSRMPTLSPSLKRP